ncbi:MAG: transglycosylase domain-containing protein [Bacilli bacterium]
MKKFNLKKRKSTKEKSNKKGNKTRNEKLWYYFWVTIISLAIAFVVIVAAFGVYIVFSAPSFNPDQLYEKESTVLYDDEGNVYATLGVNTHDGETQKREKLEYDELPEVLIDALVATEDSRFFQHNGFDFPRFLKASAGQLLGRDSGGGSTLTMQVSKNSFTNTNSSGIKGIIRKFTDIYISVFKIEKNYTKEEIIEFYVNANYLGAGSFGVEQASRTYFGKSTKDLSLTEAAVIAGLFQAPDAYDPYKNPKDAEARRNIVLSLMLRHGYITEEEANNAKAISVTSLLIGKKGSADQYQGFIDTVVQAIRDELKQDPYNVPMEIYTTMKRNKQDVVNNVYNTYAFQDEKIQMGLGMIDNKSGAILAVGAGRNKTTELSQNYATQINRHPGSTAKPLFDYGPGIEYQKWSTYGPWFDEPTKYSTGQVMNNWDSRYMGMISTTTALEQSRNTCALQAFKKNNNKQIYSFVTSLGITPQTDNGTFINEAHSVGAFDGMSPMVEAGAYSAFASGGYYTKPYSYIKIVYRETGEEYEPKITRKRVMSEQTAYLMNYMLKSVTPYQVKVSGTDIATKTGTSSYDEKALIDVGVPLSAIRDSWVATYSPDYTISFWLGYDKLEKGYYNTMGSADTQRRKIQTMLVNNIMEPNSRFKMPSGVVTSKVELGTSPAALPSAYTPSDLIATHLFIKGSEPTEESKRFSKLSDVTDLNVKLDGLKAEVSWKSPGIPQMSDPDTLKTYFTSGYSEFADKYYNQRINYNNNNIGTFGFDVYLKKGETLKYIGFSTTSSYTIASISGYDGIVVKSAYSKFKANQSDGVIKAVEGGEVVPSKVTVELKAVNGSINLNLKVGTPLPDMKKAFIVLKDKTDITNEIQDTSILYTVKDKLAGTLISGLDAIDTSKEGYYEMSYTIEYKGTKYYSAKRFITIEK